MTQRRPLVVATGNPHKVAEFTQLLGPHGFKVAGAPKGFAPVEDGDTFAANAAIKVLALRALQPADGPLSFLLADDSGLVVPALQGAPGVRSARFAQEHPSHLQDPDGANCRKLLHALRDTPSHARQAHFVCVLAVVLQDGALRTFAGEVHGHIAQEARGGTGFGYDPLFVPAGHQQTFAELGAAAKHELSHRARAVAALVAGLSATGVLHPLRS